jgi:hypothetical protein
MSESTNPTLAELDAAVEAAREVPVRDMEASLCVEYGDAPRHPSIERRYQRDLRDFAGALNALIAAAEARGEARERERNCTGGFTCGTLGGIGGVYCRICGGRVRVEESNA